MDNSFSNKVLAHRACNLQKADRTPFQAFGSTPEWDAILTLVVSLKDKALLDRFLISKEEQLQDFTKRHLSDTRYISKLAAQFVEQLYGGRDAAVPWEDSSRRCVYASSGGLTAEMRKRWGLNSILQEPRESNGSSEGKSRTDHRHHAVDAIVIALTTESMIQQAAFESQKHDRTLGFLEPRYFSPPWPSAGDREEKIAAFRNEIREIAREIKVSHRVENGLNGQLHEETFYSPKKEDSGKNGFIYSRVFVQKLSVKDIESPFIIVDKSVRLAIQRRLGDVAGDPKRLETNLPYMEKHGKKIPIRRVRIAIPAAKAQPLGIGDDQPSIFTAENHHVVVFQRIDSIKGPYWYTPGPVTRLEAMKKRADSKRKKLEQPYQIVEKLDGLGSQYVMHLMKGDAVEMLDHVNDVRDIYIFASMSDGDYAFLRHSTSVPSAKAMGLSQGQMRRQLHDRGDRVRVRMNLDKLREWDCKKVILDPLGKVIYQA